MARYTQEEIHEMKLLQNSVERMINTTLSILHDCAAGKKPDMEDVGVNLEDWEEMRHTVRRVWREAQNEVYKKRLAK